MRKWTLVFENKVETYLKSRETILRSIRKVQANGYSIVGSYPSVKNLRHVHYESTLEADFIRLLEFDLKVDRYVEQPVKINFKDEAGKSRVYTPDLLVYFKEDPDTRLPYHCPLLIEIKTRSLIKKNWKDLKPKFLEAMRYCDQVGWKFKIKTEKEIRTQFTKNVKFLLPYMRAAPDYGHVEQIYYALDQLGDASIKELTSFYSKDPMIQAQLIAPLWFLVGNLMVGCNLGEKLTANTRIWALNK